MNSPVRRFLALLGTAAGVYLVFCVGACSLQDSMIFPRDLANQGTQAGPSRAGIERHWLDTNEGPVEAWFIVAPERSDTTPGPAVIFFHGNASLIDYSLNIADIYLAMGVSVLLPEYRGYGRSAGRPGESVIVADMKRWRSWLDARPEVDRSRVIYHGQSLGGGVAAALMHSDPPAALVLHSTFTSITAMAGRMGVPSLLVRHPFRTDEALRDFDGPVLVMHGTQDTAIPVSHGRTLAKTARHATYVEGAGGHNDYPRDAELARIVREFLQKSALLDER